MEMASLHPMYRQRERRKGEETVSKRYFGFPVHCSFVDDTVAHSSTVVLV